MLPGHFMEMCEGYNAKIKREYDLHISLQNGLRKQAFFALLPHAEKGFSFYRFCKEYWPLPIDEGNKKESDNLVMSPETYLAALAAMKKQVQQSRRKKQNKAHARDRLNTTRKR